MADRTCTLADCAAPYYARDLCSRHYSQFRRGTIEAPPRTAKTLYARVMEKISVEENGCWRWTAFIKPDGYGHIKVGGQAGGTVLAHRLTYEMFVGPIPDGLQIDHLCRNRACVRPEHLEPVSPRENTMRGTSFSAVHAQLTHCPEGHPYNKANTYVSPRGGRHCRACRAAQREAARVRRYRERTGR